MKLLISLLIIIFSFLAFNFQEHPPVQNPPFYNSDTAWAQQVMSSLTLEQRIAQLFMVSAYSNKGISHQQEIENLIRKYHIGGLMFMQGGPIRQLHLTNTYQSLSKVPLIIAQDAEW